MKPYVVSCDLALLWESVGVEVPEGAIENFRVAVRGALYDSVGVSDWVTEREIRDGLAHLLTTCPVPIISLDPVYTPQLLPLSLTRLVDTDGCDAEYGLRNGGALNLSDSVRVLAETLPVPEVALVDDVLFSGALMEHLIDLFARVNVRVRMVYAGVAVGKGVDRLRCLDCPVHAVRSYQEVLDEICERDFLPGAPMSGRTVAGLCKTGVPYLLPFGRPGQWASIPEVHEKSFSVAVLRASADFYDRLGLCMGDLPRRILNVRADDSSRVSDVLRAVAKQLE